MGLFNKSKMNTEEQEVLQNMMHSELIDNLIYALENEPKYQWAIAGQHGGVHRRNVFVESGWFNIEVPGAYDKGDENHCIAINFKKSGYDRLDSRKGISCSRMCYLYATALQMRMKEILPNCEFSTVRNNRNSNQLSDESFFRAVEVLVFDQGARAEFTYTVPMPISRKLF